MEGEKTSRGAPRWRWARRLQRVFALDLAPCPVGQQGTLRRIAAITQGQVIRTILHPLHRGADPPPIAPARAGQGTFAWASS